MLTSDVKFHFEGKRIVVAGASSGMGKSITEEIVKGGVMF